MEDFYIEYRIPIAEDWAEFIEIVKNSNTELSRKENGQTYLSQRMDQNRGFNDFCDTVYFNLQNEDVPIFNPLLASFFNSLLKSQENTDLINYFLIHHKKGIEYFKERYFVKYPSKKQVKSLFEKYNTEFKNYLTTGQFVYNKKRIRDLGFSNGVFCAYSDFENDFINEFKKYSSKTNEPTKITPPPTKGKITGNHYALTYIMDCHANGIKPITGDKINLSNYFEERFKSNGVSIYSRYKEVNGIKYDLNSNDDLKAIASEHWREIILELSENPTKLEQYLKGKNL